MYEDVLRRSRRLPHWGVLVVTGADATTFLQGQLSIDLRSIAPDRVLLASVNSAQGRVQDIVWIAPRGESLLLITRSDRLEVTAARLRKYVLRAKVKIEIGTLAVAGTLSESQEINGWSAPLTQTQTESSNVIDWPGGRQLIVGTGAFEQERDFIEAWERTDIRVGLPSVRPETHELFVAQMLNLDVLGGISFDKGCYTGQEIIARTHFRGTVKRRMFRFAANCAPPAPGSKLLADSEPAGEVVAAVSVGSGCEFLAVVHLGKAGQRLHLQAAADESIAELPVPYSITSDEEHTRPAPG